MIWEKINVDLLSYKTEFKLGASTSEIRTRRNILEFQSQVPKFREEDGI